VLFIPSCPGYTGLTGALDRSDWCNPWWDFAQVNISVCLLLSCVGAISSLGPFGAQLACLVFWGFLAETGLTGVLPFCGSLHVLPVGTSLASGAHRSDQCWSVDSRFGVPLRSRVGRLCVGS
jgi:hypothetical protein